MVSLNELPRWLLSKHLQWMEACGSMHPTKKHLLYLPCYSSSQVSPTRGNACKSADIHYLCDTQTDQTLQVLEGDRHTTMVCLALRHRICF
jgi:hypothetical protein